MKQTGPKILLWDLETSHNIAATFGLFKVTIPPECIIKERSIICGSYKWLGQDKIHNVSVLDNKKLFKKDRYNDYHVVKALRDVLAEADIIIAHNGDFYDTKFFNTRCLYHGLEPIDKPISIDTYKVAKKYFRFNSNRLGYISKLLGHEGKSQSGLSLWLDFAKADDKQATVSIKKMISYCNNDVLQLEKVYLDVRPYIYNHPNLNLLVDTEDPVCPSCAGDHLQKHGTRRSGNTTYQRFKCNDCGSYSRGIKSIGKVYVK